MLAQQIQTPAQSGEDQSSPDVFAARQAHWANAAIGLLSAAKIITMARDVTDLSQAELHQMVAGLSAAVDRAEGAGLTLKGTLQLANGEPQPAQFWSVINDRFSAGSVPDLIAANDWLRPGDVVYQAQTIRRHKLTEADFEAAAALSVIGGAA